ncbi:Ribonuclease HII [hydrothermal vent metagenome]|uniref:Ribonuclease HII n=1 Tax=hydrothermal vent metagenome TaxID=652676 RepID=A0A3B1C391_9ZZZZ
MNKLKKYDRKFLDTGHKFIAGVDEAGRGPLAGPVVAAAVIFDSKTVIEEVNDSKKVPEKVREQLYDIIIEHAVNYGVGIVDEKTIDEINILQATMMAMKEAINNLSITPDLILIDGNRTFESKLETLSVVKGDSLSFSIAAASIIAKVTRDRIMRIASEEFPEYLWHKNKGYGTKEHIAAIKDHGPTSFHRISFLGNILDQDILLENI